MSRQYYRGIHDARRGQSPQEGGDAYLRGYADEYNRPGGITMHRADVYVLINQEREYQEKRWNLGTTPSGGDHEVGAFLVFMQDYLTEAIHQITRSADPEASQQALDTVRKITALGVVCMEQHGAPARKPL